MRNLKNKIMFLMLFASLSYQPENLAGTEEVKPRTFLVFNYLKQLSLYNKIMVQKEILLTRAVYGTHLFCAASVIGWYILPTMVSPGFLGFSFLVSHLLQRQVNKSEFTEVKQKIKKLKNISKDIQAKTNDIQAKTTRIEKAVDIVTDNQGQHREETKNGFEDLRQQVVENQLSTNAQLSELGNKQKETHDVAVLTSNNVTDLQQQVVENQLSTDAQLTNFSGKQKETHDVAVSNSDKLVQQKQVLDKILSNDIEKEKKSVAEHEVFDKRHLEMENSLNHLSEQQKNTQQVVEETNTLTKENTDRLNNLEKNVATITVTTLGMVGALNALSDEQKIKNALINQLIDQQKKNEDSSQAIKLQLVELTQSNANQFSTILEYVKPKEVNQEHHIVSKKQHDVQMKTGRLSEL